MAQHSKIIDLNRTYLPIDPIQLTQNMPTPQEDTPEKSPPVMAYDGKNFMPSFQGYQSYFGLSQVSINALGKPCDFIFLVQEADFSNIFVALCSDGIYSKDASSGGAWTLSQAVAPASTEIAHYLWTFAILENVLYVYRAGNANVYAIATNPAFAVSVLTPTHLTMVGQVGIFKAGGRLGIWDSLDSVSWSAYADPMDHLPSITTQANAAKFKDVIGKIVMIKQCGNGFVIYSTKSIVLIQRNEGNVFGWKPTVLSNGSGIAYPRQVAIADPDKIHFAWTNTGLVKIEETDIQQVAPEFWDYLTRGANPIYVKILNGRYLCLECRDRSLVGYSRLFLDQFDAIGADATPDAEVLAIWNDYGNAGLNYPVPTYTTMTQEKLNGAIVKMETTPTAYLRPIVANRTNGRWYPTAFVKRWSTMVTLKGELAAANTREDPAFVREANSITWTDAIGMDIQTGSLVPMGWYKEFMDARMPGHGLPYLDPKPGTHFKARQLSDNNNRVGADAFIWSEEPYHIDAHLQDLVGFFAAQIVIWDNDLRKQKLLLDDIAKHVGAGGTGFDLSSDTSVQGYWTANQLQVNIIQDEATGLWHRTYRPLYEYAEDNLSFVPNIASELSVTRDFFPGTLGDISYHVNQLYDADPFGVPQHPVDDQSAGLCIISAKIVEMEQLDIVRRNTINTANVRYEIFLYTGSHVDPTFRLSTVNQFATKAAAQAWLRTHYYNAGWLVRDATVNTYTETTVAVTVDQWTAVPRMVPAFADSFGLAPIGYIIIPSGSYHETIGHTVERTMLDVSDTAILRIAGGIVPSHIKLWNAGAFTDIAPFDPTPNTTSSLPIFPLQRASDRSHRIGYFFHPEFITHDTFAGSQPLRFVETSGRIWIMGGPSGFWTIPPDTMLLGIGLDSPKYTSAVGGFVYDMHLKKWGKFVLPYKQLVDIAPINVDGKGVIRYTKFGVAGGVLDDSGFVQVFNINPKISDSLIVYGKFGLTRSGMTTIEEIIVHFSLASTGSIETESSLDGKNIRASLSKVKQFEAALTVNMPVGVTAKWFNILFRGQFDINYIEVKCYQAGRR